MEWDLPKILQGLSLGVDTSMSGQAAPEMRTPVAREVRQNPDVPPILTSGGSPWVDLLQTGLAAAGAAGLLGPGSQQLGALNERLKEKRRVDLAGQQTQAMTGMISSALESGDPEQLSSAIKQMSGMKGLQPETVQSMQKLQVGLAEKISVDRQEAQLAQALSEASPEHREVVGKLLKSVPGLKLGDAVKLFQSGLLGERSKVMTVANVGVVRIPGTGLFASKNPQENEPQLIIGNPGSQTEKAFSINDLAYTAATGKPAATTQGISQKEASAALELLKEQRQVLTPTAQGQRVEVAQETARATATQRSIVEAEDQLNEIHKSRSITDALFGLADTFITAENATDAVMQGGKLYLGALSKTHPAAATYQDQKGQFAGQLARSLGGERGVLTEGDINRTIGGFPTFRDTRAIKDFKKGVINTLIEASIEAKKARIEGRPFDEKGFKARKDKLLGELEKASTQTPPPPGFRYVPGRTDLIVGPNGEMRKYK